MRIASPHAPAVAGALAALTLVALTGCSQGGGSSAPSATSPSPTASIGLSSPIGSGGSSACYTAEGSRSSMAIAIPISVPEGGDPLTITAVDDADESHPDSSVVFPADRDGGNAEYLSSQQLAEDHPEQWEQRRPAIGATIQPGQTMTLAVSYTFTGGAGESKTWKGPVIRYRQGGQDLTATSDSELTLMRGTCPQTTEEDL